jgi:glyoxylase-like metal-dependent hydrolase (beta-lactamase superfamily II)
MADGAWMVEGPGFPAGPLAGNQFILRDRGLVVLLYAGNCPEQWPDVFGLLRRLAERGAEELAVLPGRGRKFQTGHQAARQAGYQKVRHLSPQPDFQAITNHDDRPSTPDRADDHQARRAARARAAGPEHGVGPAEVLAWPARQELAFGQVKARGWPVGRFFVIPESVRSPGHISLYDPVNKLMITGDSTLETNPRVGGAGLGECIEVCRRNLGLAEQGHILLATDRYRSSRHWPAALAARGLTPLAPVQLADMARGRRQCAALYRMWTEYFSALREEAHLAHSRIGEATLSEIAQELAISLNPEVVFKAGLTPRSAHGLETLVVDVLEESRAARRVVGDRILFRPVEKWKFAGGHPRPSTQFTGSFTA